MAMLRGHRFILVVLSATVVVQICGALVVRHKYGRLDDRAFASVDAREYYRIAGNVARHGRFSHSAAPPLEPDTWRTPGYPLLLAGIMRLSRSDSPVLLLVIQQLLSGVNVLLVAGMVRRHAGPRRALVAAVLYLAEPYHHLYSWWLMSTTVFVSLLLLTWLAWQWAMGCGRWYAWSAAGLLAGCAVLVRPLGILVPIVVALGSLLMFRRRSCLRALMLGCVPALLGSTLVIGCWTVRNQLVAGHLALSHQSGPVLAYFKATEVVLWRQGRSAYRYQETALDPPAADQPHTVWEDIDARLRNRLAHLPEGQLNRLRWSDLARGRSPHVDPFVVSAALRRIAWAKLLDEPLSTLSCCLARCVSILSFPLNLAVRPPAGDARPDVARAAVVGGAYLLLALGALWRSLRGGYALKQFYFPAACTLALLLAATPQLDPRFRVPMIPFLIFIALLPKGFGPQAPGFGPDGATSIDSVDNSKVSRS